MVKRNDEIKLGESLSKYFEAKESQKRRRPSLVFLFTGLIIFLIDRGVKNYFVANPEIAIDLGAGFGFRLQTNEGVAFGLPLPGMLALGLAIVLTIILIHFIIKSLRQEEVGEAVALGAVTVGAISNLIDRVRFGAVIDYIDVRWFTVFNLADAMITLGVLAALIMAFRRQS
ncbi:signal peptidase II [archaeon]|nr:signal peptidase II [archaeon]|tara:strand:+ start:139 stop:654 length:516 start_codon:yes stop_codon:yes gene_type:complete